MTTTLHSSTRPPLLLGRPALPSNTSPPPPGLRQWCGRMVRSLTALSTRAGADAIQIEVETQHRQRDHLPRRVGL